VSVLTDKSIQLTISRVLSRAERDAAHSVTPFH